MVSCHKPKQCSTCLLWHVSRRYALMGMPAGMEQYMTAHQGSR